MRRSKISSKPCIDCEAVTLRDLDAIRAMQPPGWTGFDQIFRFYIDSDFCHPLKIVNNHQIEGIGVSIHYKTTSWLAHIIVDEKFRNRGIGGQMVDALIRRINPGAEHTILLIATPLGEPVYRKAGFRVVTEYVFFKRETPAAFITTDPCTVPFETRYETMIYALDRAVTGEYRRSLIQPHLKHSMLYVNKGRVLGYYLPGPGEGPIIAKTPEAGHALMSLKYERADKAVLPADNVSGMRFLIEHGFKKDAVAPRMILGPDIQWQPEKIYSRIGGNFG